MRINKQKVIPAVVILLVSTLISYSASLLIRKIEDSSADDTTVDTTLYGISQVTPDGSGHVDVHGCRFIPEHTSTEECSNILFSFDAPNLPVANNFFINQDFDYSDYYIFNMWGASGPGGIHMIPGGAYYALKTSFPDNISKINLPEPNATLVSLLKKNNRVYVLSYIRHSATNYTNIVYETTNLTTYTEVLRFSYGSLARSFEKLSTAEEFVFGIGSEPGATNAQSGDILRIALSDITPPPVVNPPGSFENTSTFQIGTNTGLTFVVEKEYIDSEQPEIKVNGTTLVYGTNYSLAHGSGATTRVTLLPAYLDTLPVGSHALTVLFSDTAQASGQFTITAADPQDPGPGPGPGPDPQDPDPDDPLGIDAPNTGSGNKNKSWLRASNIVPAIILATGISLTVFLARPKSKCKWKGLGKK